MQIPASFLLLATLVIAAGAAMASPTSHAAPVAAPIHVAAIHAAPALRS